MKRHGIEIDRKRSITAFVKREGDEGRENRGKEERGRGIKKRRRKRKKERKKKLCM